MFFKFLTLVTQFPSLTGKFCGYAATSLTGLTGQKSRFSRKGKNRHHDNLNYIATTAVIAW
jgi:hypothetical protein